MIIPTVHLVGAGPGDPELITVKALRAIQSANAILYDALIPKELLVHAKRGCKILYVGKRSGCHSFSQQEINQMIISNAFKYEQIVRLKGGDPFVFGRAHEEISAAMNAGIHVEVIPGISSAIAVPESMMIPITCRGMSESFWVTTGTTQTGEISTDILLAARSTATVIILMAMSKLEEIMQIFVNNGRSDLPVAIIQEGCTGNSKMITGTASDIYNKAQQAAITNPAIIVAGNVVNIRYSLADNLHEELLALTHG